MSSEAITRNDLTAILNEVLPPTPSEYRKLLWTNPSPSSNFSAQTVSLDLSDYDEIELFYAGTTDYANTAIDYIKVAIGKGGLLNMSANEIWWRYVTASSTGVTFDTGYRTPTYGANSTADNKFIIPLKFYGIKYERVALPQTDVEVLTVNTNSAGATGTLSAFRYGRLVLVTGTLTPKLTGTGLQLATVVNAPSISGVIAQCGGYANASQELYMTANSNTIIFNVSAISDLKVNFCYITTA